MTAAENRQRIDQIHAEKGREARAGSAGRLVLSGRPRPKPSGRRAEPRRLQSGGTFGSRLA